MNANQLLQALIAGEIDLDEYRAMCRRNGIRNVLVYEDRPVRSSPRRKADASVSWEKVAEWTMS